MDVLQEAEVKDEIDNCHRRWCPEDISDCKVLDLGAGSGTDFGIELASRARSYVANDLSRRRLGQLEEKLDARGIQEYRLISMDFLESDFPEADFDLVYARAVMHHFKDIQSFLELLWRRVRPGAVILTHDPLMTWTPYRVFRLLYAPLQSDSAWEHPFTRSSLRTIQDVFRIDRVQGLMGRSKWAILAALVSRSFAASVARAGHRHDIEHATKIANCLDCLQITMRLSKPE